MKRRDFLNKVLLTGGYCAFPFNSPIFSLDKPAFNEKELQTPKFLIQYIGDNTDYYQKLKHSLSNYPVILKKFDYQKTITLQEYSIWLKTYRKKISDDSCRDLLYTPFVIQVFEIEHQIMAHILHVLQREAGLLSLSIPIGENIDIKINENILKRRFRRILIPISEKDTVATARLNIEIFLKYIFFQVYNKSFLHTDYLHIMDIFSRYKKTQLKPISNFITDGKRIINKKITNGIVLMNYQNKKIFSPENVIKGFNLNNLDVDCGFSFSTALPNKGILLYEI